MSDPVRQLLERLDGDVARMPGSDAASVRRRGDQRRRRHQALVATGSAAAVVVVALLPLGLNGLTGSDRAPAASSAPSVSTTSPLPSGASSSPSTASPSPTITPTPELKLDLLRPAELPGPATPGGRWQAVSAQSGSVVAKCVDPSGFAANASAVTGWYATTADPRPSDEIAVERLLSFATSREASTALSSLISTARACAYNADPATTPTAGDEAKTLYFRYDNGGVDSASMQDLVVVRVGARLAVLVVAMEGNGDIPYIDDLQTKLPPMLAGQLKGQASS